MFAQGFTRSHICSVQHLRKRAELLTPIPIMLTKIQTQRQSKERNNGFSKLISRKSQAYSWAVCIQDSQKTHKREMKSKYLPWRKISCLRSPPVALMQKQTVTPHQIRASSQTFHPSGQFPPLSALDTLRALPPELHSWLQSSCKVCTKSSCVVLCDAPMCICRDATH